MIRLVLIFALIAGGGIAASSLAARRAYEQQVAIERGMLDHAIEEHARQVRDRLADRELLARVAVGLIQTPVPRQSNPMAPLRAAIETFQSDFLVAGWIAHIDPSEFGQLPSLLQGSGFPDARVRQFDGSPWTDGDVPKAPLNVLMDIEPRTPSLLDWPGRVVDRATILATVLQRAAELRAPTCTDPVILPQSDSVLGVLLVSPVYEPSSAKLYGYATFSYRLSALMLAHDPAAPFNVALRDPRGSGTEFIAEDAPTLERFRSVPIQILQNVAFGGRQWTLGYTAKQDPTSRAFSLAMVVATIGFALTSVICGLFGYVAFNNLRLSREIEARLSFEDRLSAVIGELNHRVKNILAVIQSIVTRTLRDGTDIHLAREMLIGRIHAMSHVVSLLSDSDWQGVRLRSLLESSVAPGLRQVEATGPDMTISPRAAQSLALLFFELATVAADQAEQTVPRRIVLSWEKAGVAPDAKFNLRWEEFDSLRQRSGSEDDFSDVLLDRVVPEALGGTAKRYFTDQSYVYELQASLATVVDQSELDRTSRLSGRSPR